MDDIVTMQEVSKSFGPTKAVNVLNLTISKGEFFGFIGHNGAGKTTTIRLIAGILKPDHGKISVAGFDQGDRIAISELLGVMPESRGFYDWMSAIEYLTFFSRLYGLKGDRAAKRIKEVLGRTDLVQYRNKPIGAYSRGMKQRLSLSRALINDPQLLVLDEPTLGLDPQGQEDIQQLLKQANDRGVTIFYSSHLLHEVSQICSRVAIINQGSLIDQGTVEELMNRSGSHSLTDVFMTLTRRHNV
jgi:ABC-type multidrug transport system ATPase subunit